MKAVKKFACFALAVLVFLALGAPAFAVPVAKVAAFEGGEGLEEFLRGVDSSKISRAERSGDYDDTAVVVVPLLKDCHIYFYGATLNENFEVVPDRNNPIDFITEGATDHGILFWCSVPEGIPAIVVVLSVEEGKNSRSEYFWSPAFSGFDGSLVTNDEFVPF